MTLKSASVRLALSGTRPLFTLILSLTLLVSFQADAIQTTFDEVGMRDRINTVPDASTYYKSSALTLLSTLDHHTSHKARKKSKRLVEIVNKAIKLKDPVTRRKMDLVTDYIERARPALNFYLEKHSSIYIHSDSVLPYSIVAYRSGRIYIIFNDTDSKKGGYKKFTRSIEYNSEKPHAHLTIRKKKPNSRLEEVIPELKIQQTFHNSPAILSFLDSDVYTSKSSDTYENVVAIEEELYDGDLLDMVAHCPKIEKTVDLFIAMARAVYELHAGNYLHRDIKPDNFFYKVVDGKTKVVLGDFGLAQSKNSNDLGTYLCGTSGFIDPHECVNEIQLTSGFAFVDFEEGKLGDVFSLGMTFMDILHGQGHALHTQTITVNDMVFDPKLQKKGTSSILDAAERFKKVHGSTFPSGGENLLGEQDLLFKVHQTIGKMLHPNANARPNLLEVMDALHKIKSQSKPTIFHWPFANQHVSYI